MRKSTLRRHAVNVNEEWPLHPDVSRSGRASVQLNGYRIGCGWKKSLVGISMPRIQNHAPVTNKIHNLRELAFGRSRTNCAVNVP
jgi:hypothetical protein